MRIAKGGVMTSRYSALLVVLAMLAGCGPADEAPPAASKAPAPEQRFDAAVEQMTRAYFTHVPEAATQLGIAEEAVPGTSRRMMDRSLDGNAARNRA